MRSALGLDDNKEYVSTCSLRPAVDSGNAEHAAGISARVRCVQELLVAVDE